MLEVYSAFWNIFRFRKNHEILAKQNRMESREIGFHPAVLPFLPHRNRFRVPRARLKGYYAAGAVVPLYFTSRPSALTGSV